MVLGSYSYTLKWGLKDAVVLGQALVLGRVRRHRPLWGTAISSPP
eukprot:SAG11_NODE_35270_length_267_cov_0.916667_1_plen_44_part_10